MIIKAQTILRPDGSFTCVVSEVGNESNTALVYDYSLSRLPEAFESGVWMLNPLGSKAKK